MVHGPEDRCFAAITLAMATAAREILRQNSSGQVAPNSTTLSVRAARVGDKAGWHGSMRQQLN